MEYSDDEVRKLKLYAIRAIMDKGNHNWYIISSADLTLDPFKMFLKAEFNKTQTIRKIKNILIKCLGDMTADAWDKMKDGRDSYVSWKKDAWERVDVRTSAFVELKTAWHKSHLSGIL